MSTLENERAILIRELAEAQNRYFAASNAHNWMLAADILLSLTGIVKSLALNQKQIELQEKGTIR